MVYQTLKHCLGPLQISFVCILLYIQYRKASTVNMDEVLTVKSQNIPHKANTYKKSICAVN
jgi:hypothetical protein